MREILFRGKRTDNGEWVYGYYFYDSFYEKAYITLGNNVLKVSEENPNKRVLEAFEVIPETVGRDTGFKDKNGKKIFEGDILKVKSMWHVKYPENSDGFFTSTIKQNTYWSVEHKVFNGEMGFMLYGINRRWHTLLTYNKLFNAEAVVAGNIHDNPELLKES